MDADARAELAALRRRAYSRDADIAGDPVALQRLAELEERALPASPEHASVQSRAAGAPEAVTPTSDHAARGAPASHPPSPDGQPAVPPVPGRASPRRGLIFGLVAAVAVLAAAAGAARGFQTLPDPTPAATPAASPTSRSAIADVSADDPVIIPLLIDSLRGEFVDFSSRPDVPTLLADGVTTWVQPLGVYHGWSLWVAGVSGGQRPENCLLLTDGTATEAQCVPVEAAADGSLGVSLAHDELAEYQRPPGMTPDQRVAFEWSGGAYVTMEVTDSG
ncbi:MAG TPA: hypothetical protein VFY91_13020 [Microbacterium sp.]|nr:hypothetical protein [Microbacterium sp.]